MTSVGVISLPRFRDRAERVAAAVEGDLLDHAPGVFATAFERYDALVAVMSAGIAVRAVAPLLRDKWTDPPLVVVSPDLRFAVPVLGGHHGGNALARRSRRCAWRDRRDLDRDRVRGPSLSRGDRRSGRLRGCEPRLDPGL